MTERKKTHEYWHDQLLISIANTMQHLVFNCSPAGAADVRRELDDVKRQFEKSLNALTRKDRTS